jgi:hypothetical protein
MRIAFAFRWFEQFVKEKRGETGHCICGATLARDRCANWTACALVVIAISRAPKDVCRVHKRQQMVSSRWLAADPRSAPGVIGIPKIAHTNQLSNLRKYQTPNSNRMVQG